MVAQRRVQNIVLHNKINEDSLQREFLASLQNRKIDSKFLYWGRIGTERWQALCQDKSYLYYQRELALLKKAAAKLCDSVHSEPNRHYNLIALGIGNGDKDRIIIENCYKKGRIGFFPIDISEDMVRDGIEQIPISLLETMEAYVADFSQLDLVNQAIRSANFPNNFFLLLGNSVMSINELDVFRRLNKGMSAGDYLLLGVLLHDPNDVQSISRLLEMYTTPVFQNFILSPLERIGISSADGNIEAEYGTNRFFPQIYTIEVFFSCKKNITCNYFQQEISLLKGERIRLFQSHLYPEGSMQEVLEGTGFRIVDHFSSTDKLAGLFLCTK